MICQKRRLDVKAIGVVEIRYCLSNGPILLRPSDKVPASTASPMLPQYRHWKYGCGFVCCLEIVIMMVDINGKKHALSPNLNSEKEDPAVTFPARKDLTNNSVG